MDARELQPADLYRRTDPERLGFETTAELEALGDALGQPRAVAACELAVGVEQDGYNLFALGPPGLGRHRLVERYLEHAAAKRPPPPDLCYVHNFEEASRPHLLRLPAGRGTALRHDMEALVEELAAALASTFESDEYHARRQSLEQEFQERQAAMFESLQAEAKKRGLTTLRTPMGIVFAPLSGDEVISPEEFAKLPPEERSRFEGEIQEMQGELQRALRQVPRWQREARERMRELNREAIRFAVGPHLDELRKKYDDLPDVVAHLERVEEDVVANARDLLAREDSGEGGGSGGGGDDGSSPTSARSLRRYGVNVLVDHGPTAAAPVVHEDNPNYHNLVGRVEHVSQMGTLVTDFQLIRAGAFHRANGGYLVLEAERVLVQPYAWDALKRTLQSGKVRMESLAQALSLLSTVSLEPEPLPVDVKVVLVGSRLLYYLLCSYDPDFLKLFKVAADFEESVERSEDNERLFARLLASLVDRDGLLPLDRAAVARVIEESARAAGDAERLSIQLERLDELLREAAYWAGQGSRERVTAEDVQKAIDQRIFRADRLRERLQEEILRQTIFVDTDGAAVGQLNGLSVLQLGSFAFGRPSRITARVWMGKGEVVDIEREVELSGPIHSKGVLILAAYLSGRYAGDRPLALSASLVFEQSYGGIDGDSASSAELYTLLSAISGLPLRQDLAVTGSVNQHGRVQPIGGVNEKIEGFFDICRARGLTGQQGVLIPDSNVKHLMLRADVVEAVAAGHFHVHPVADVDQGIALLTGVEAGERDAQGRFPEGSVHRLVEDRLAELSEKRKEFTAAAAAGGGGEEPAGR